MNQENKRPSDAELNARFDSVMQQRNNALNQNIIDAGTIAMLREELEKLTKTDVEEVN